MLVGQFELLLAKQEEYDAWQGYLEAVRDYWVARSDLERAIGGALPGAAAPGAPGTPTIGPQDLPGMPTIPDPDR
jgi:cobalt-zinc-cadmium efflux system outer membrane protein